MVERILNFFQRESSSLHEAAFLLGSLALVSQILALIRDRLLAASFGAGLELDTYYAAFRVPDLLYVSLASFMSVTVVLPFFTKHLERGDRASAEHLMNDLFRIFLGLMLTAIVILYWFMPQILAWVAPGFDPAHQLELLKLSRILLLSPLLLGLSNLVATVTQSSRKFLLYALSPVLYNLGIIAGIIFLYPVLGLAGLTWGVVIGAFAHLAIQWPAFRRGPVSFRLRRRAPITNRAEWRTVLLLSLPRTLTLSAHQLSIVVLVALASYLAAGSIAVFNFAYNLQAVLLSIIGVSYSVATFPALVRLFTNGNQKQFVEHLGTAARHIVFWSLPTLTLFIVLRAQIVRVILGAGKFDWADTRLTAAATAIFLVSVAAQSLILLFVRGYYACGKTRRPLVINTLSSVLIIIFSYSLLHLARGYPGFNLWLAELFRVSEVAGVELLLLPLAFTLGVLINLAIFWIVFKRDFGSFPSALYRSFGQSAAAALGGGVVAYLLLQLFAPVVDQTTVLGVFNQGFWSGLGGITAAVIILRWFKNEEIREISQSLHRKFWQRSKTVLPAAEEL